MTAHRLVTIATWALIECGQCGRRWQQAFSDERAACPYCSVIRGVKAREVS